MKYAWCLAICFVTGCQKFQVGFPPDLDPLPMPPTAVSPLPTPVSEPPQPEKTGSPLKKPNDAVIEEVFLTVASTQKRARVEARKRYPIPDRSKDSYDLKFASSQRQMQADLLVVLTLEYRREAERKLAQKYGLTPQQIADIFSEGVRRGWLGGYKEDGGV